MCFTSTVSSRIAICVGGRVGNNFAPMEVYSFQSNMWTPFEPAHTGLHGMLTWVTQFTFEGKHYFVGGDCQTHFSARIYLFNPENVTISQVGVLSQPMQDPVVILFNIPGK